MFRNKAGQKFTVFAFDSATGLPKTGDAANITASVSKDDAAAADLTDTSATEIDATKAKGYYLFDATQAETDGDKILVTARSTTSGIAVVGAPAVIFTLPNTGLLAPATAGRTVVVDAAGLVDANAVKVGPTGAGTAQTARDLGTSVLLSNGTGTGQVKLAAGYVAMTLADVAAPSGNSAQALGVLWQGTLSAVAATTITLPGGHNLDHEGNYAVRLLSGTNADGKARFLTYSGAGEVWTVDPAWNSNGETTPSGSVVAQIVNAEKVPTTTIPNVNVTKVNGTPQTAGDVMAAIAALNTALAAYSAATAASVSAVPAGVLTAAAAAPIAADIKKVNAVTVQGAGTTGNPWRPA